MTRPRGRRVLVLVHTDVLVRQAERKIKLVDPAADTGICKAERDEHDATIVIASIQTLSRPERLARVRPDFDFVVVDEAHHAAAPSYITTLEYFGCFGPDGPVLLGFTATGERADGAALGDVFDEVTFERDILEMIGRGYLCDLRAIRVHIEAANLDLVHSRGGDLVAGELADELIAADAPHQIVEAWKEHAPGLRTLVFAANVRMAHIVAETYREAGVSAEAVDGTTPLDERHAILERFHVGETRVLSNCSVLLEGYDEPAISCVVIARPTESRPLFTQMVGRGTRTFPSKRDCLILDVTGATQRHQLQSIATLAGSQVKEVRDGESLIEAVARERAEQPDKVAVEGELVAEVVDLFAARKMRWTSSGSTRHILGVGDGIIVMHTDDMASWTAEHVARDRTRTLIAENLDIGYCQGSAEDFARKLGAGALTKKNAHWHNDPATERQLAGLARWGIYPGRPLTKIEASDLMNAASAKAIQ